MAFRAEISPEKLGYKVGAILMALREGTTDIPENVKSESGKLQTVNYLWNTATLDYEIETVSTGGGGGGSTTVDANLTSAGSTRLVGQVTVANPTTSVNVANPTTAVNVANQPTVDLSSAGSTRLVGKVDVNNPTTLVTVSSGVILGAGSSANMLGQVAQGAGSTSIAPWYVISTAGGGGSTTVDANLTSVGSTRSVGTVNQGSPAGSSADAWWVRTVSTNSLSGSTTVDANLTSAGSTKLVGMVELASGSTARVIGSVTLASGSTAFLAGAVAVSSGVVLGAGSSSNTLGSVALVAGSTANTIGAVQQGAPAASSDNAWWVRTVSTGSAGSGSTTVDANITSAGSTKQIGLVDGVGFTTGGLARTTVNSSVDASLFAANANRKGICIANGSTATALLVSLNSTVAVSSAGSYSFQVPALGFVFMGGQVGQLPNFTGLARCKMNSTLVAGPVFVTEYTS